MTTPNPWPALSGISYGGDYNPEQWPRAVWDEDVALMREAGVDLVSVGIFSWALIETSPGVFDFSWLDDVLELLHANGIAVDLGTPTASPPAWFFANHPDARAVTRQGIPVGFGSRGMASHSSPAYHEATARICGALAERYGNHPAVVLWHIHNEYGQPVGEDYSGHSVRAFRIWLRERYATLEALNSAWGTAVWGQHYGSWEHIGVPAYSNSVVNPAQRLDFARFTDDRLLHCYRIEKQAIRQHSDLPITTNFMAHECLVTDLWRWAEEVDVVSNDHYLKASDPEAQIGLAMAADLTRSVAGGRPWILMEHSTSAVNWQPRNIAKRPGEMARNSLTHLARGADAILFFQWRAARHGQEKFHSAMLPHAGTTSRAWREVVALGESLDRLAPLRDSRVAASVAILWDYESMWAQDLEWRPSEDLSHQQVIRSYYERLWRDNITVDFALPSHDLSRYRLVVAPAQYLLRAADAERLNRYVEEGGTLLVSYFSAVVDEHDAVHELGFLSPLEPALGVTVEEFLPLRLGEHASIRDTAENRFTSTIWQECLVVHGAETWAHYDSGPGAGGAAVTRNRHGQGVGWYVSTQLNPEGIAAIMAEVYRDAGVAAAPWPDDVEVVTRRGTDCDFTTVINHSESDATLGLAGKELIRGNDTDGRLRIPAGEVAIVQQARHSPETS